MRNKLKLYIILSLLVLLITLPFILAACQKKQTKDYSVYSTTWKNSSDKSTTSTENIKLSLEMDGNNYLRVPLEIKTTRRLVTNEGKTSLDAQFQIKVGKIEASGSLSQMPDFVEKTYTVQSDDQNQKGEKKTEIKFSEGFSFKDMSDISLGFKIKYSEKDEKLILKLEKIEGLKGGEGIGNSVKVITYAAGGSEVEDTQPLYNYINNPFNKSQIYEETELGADKKKSSVSLKNSLVNFFFSFNAYDIHKISDISHKEKDADTVIVNDTSSLLQTLEDLLSKIKRNKDVLSSTLFKPLLDLLENMGISNTNEKDLRSSIKYGKTEIKITKDPKDSKKAIKIEAKQENGSATIPKQKLLESFNKTITLNKNMDDNAKEQAKKLAAEYVQNITLTVSSNTVSEYVYSK